MSIWRTQSTTPDGSSSTSWEKVGDKLPLCTRSFFSDQIIIVKKNLIVTWRPLMTGTVQLTVKVASVDTFRGLQYRQHRQHTHTAAIFEVAQT